MSGAGRGIPRVSPTADVPALPPSGVPGNIVEVSSAKFIYRNNLGVTNMPLTASLTFAATGELPLGVSRACIDLFYNKADPAASLVVKIDWSPTTPLLLPQAAALGTVTMGDKEYRIAETGSSFLTFVVPPCYQVTNGIFQSFTVSVAETGAGTPGTVTLGDFFADNISPLPYEPNFTV